MLNSKLHCQELVPECEAIKDKFEPLLLFFARCHSIYDSLSVHDLQNYVCFMHTVGHVHYCFAEEAITSFLSYYRHTFPEASITVKMHLLEDHMVPFLQQSYRVGFGLMGEQGAESIHAELRDDRRYVNIPDKVERL